MRIQSFPPLGSRDANCLILGSMPGVASLEAQQYYAHPRNAFWSIIDAVLGIARSDDYPQRVRKLVAARIAVWDVLAHCTRPGSLDSSIEADSVVANDLRTFLRQHPGIERICFNGATARRLFERHVQATLTPQQQEIEKLTLPSTSPAHAGKTLADKTRVWAAALRPAQRR